MGMNQYASGVIQNIVSKMIELNEVDHASINSVLLFHSKQGFIVYPIDLILEVMNFIQRKHAQIRRQSE